MSAVATWLGCYLGTPICILLFFPFVHIFLDNLLSGGFQPGCLSSELSGSRITRRLTRVPGEDRLGVLTFSGRLNFHLIFLFQDDTLDFWGPPDQRLYNWCFSWYKFSDLCWSRQGSHTLALRGEVSG